MAWLADYKWKSSIKGEMDDHNFKRNGKNHSNIPGCFGDPKSVNILPNATH
jgi:hypothetical protein